MRARDIFERDDISKLPLPAAAKRYARRKGLRSMMRQPKDFKHVNALLTNPGRPDKFKNYDVSGKVHKAFKESQKQPGRTAADARYVVERLLAEVP